jgi:hypothetical protein
MSDSTLSRYPDHIRDEMIDIPAALRAFFKARKNHFIQLPHCDDSRREISYHSIVGKNPSASHDPSETPDELKGDVDAIVNTNEFPFHNTTSESTADALKCTEKALVAVFGPGTYSDIKRAYMLKTSTRPIKVRFKRNGEKSRQALYVKRPDGNRIVGKFIYQLISGNIEDTRYGFNRAVFLEQGIRGQLHSTIDEDLYLENEDYVTGLVKAGVHANFMGVQIESGDGRNRIVIPNKQTVLFDFNILFSESRDRGMEMLKPYVGGGKLPYWAVDVMLEEQRAVAKRIESRYDDIQKFAKASSDVTCMITNTTIKQRMNSNYGCRSLNEYVDGFLEDHS